MNTENHLVQHTFKFKRKKNVVKKFLQLIDTHFPPTNKLHGISQTVTPLKLVTAAPKKMIKRKRDTAKETPSVRL